MKRSGTARNGIVLLWTFVSLLMLGFAERAHAQQRRVTGTVTTEGTGKPVGQATVQVKGTTRSAVTNDAGVFAIDAASGETLVITSIGFGNREIRVGNDATIAVSLQETSRTLDDVVVVGYGRMRRIDQTGAQTTITSADLNKTVNTTIEQAIQGRAAGVYVTQNTGQPGGGISVNIRGISTINGTTEPLYVVDGVQIQPQSVSYGATSSTNPLAGLNPNDIESVELLQGPSATAVYGSRGTNGVVLITTKRGKNGNPKLNYTFQRSLQEAPTPLPTLNLREYATMVNEIRNLTGGTLTPEFRNPSVLGEGTNWQKELFRLAPMNKHQVSLSGGINNTTYFMSGEYLNQEGVAIGSAFNRYSFRLNFDNQTAKWLKLSTSLNFYQTREELASTSEDVIRNSLNLAPNVAVKNPNGSWGGATTNEFGTNAQYAPLNPVAIANLVENRFKRTGGLGSLGADITLLKGLVFRTSFNGNFEYGDGDRFTPTYRLGYVGNDVATLSISNSRNFYWNLNELLQYNTTFGRHNLGVMASHEAQSWNYEGYNATRQGFVSNSVPAFNLGNAQGQTTGSYKGSGAMESYLGRVNYTYNNKYIVQLAGRADGSSNFGVANRWGYFPSVSAAWRVSEEPFFQSVNFINDLRIRAEWGTTGNQGSAGGQFGSLGATATPWGTGFRATRHPNENLQWEATETRNLGFNLAMLNNRIQLEGDFYVKKTDNLLLTLPAPDFMGVNGEGSIGSPLVNIGSLQNKGFAFTLNTVNMDRKNGLSWRSNFNISHFRTNITNFYSDAAIVQRTAWFMNNFTQRSVVGQAPWLFYGYVSDGLFQSVEEVQNSARPLQSDGVTPLPVDANNGVWVGDIKYKDLNGDNKIDDRDQTFIGNPWPKFTYGFTNTFGYKNFDLNILLTASQGNDIYNYIRFENTNPNNINLGRNLLQETFDYARLNTDNTGKVGLTNPGTTIPRIRANDVNGNGARFSSLFVEDGSYIRVKNVQLGYSLPSRLLQRQSVAKGLRLSLGVQNLFTFTKYKGFDPEVGAYVGRESQVSAQLIGVDAGRYPLTRLYTFNVGVDF